MGIGCLGLLVIGAIAAAALWVTKPWAPDVEVVDPGPGGVRVSADGLLGNYYAADETRPSPMVLVGVEHWTRRLPAWPLLQSLGDGRAMGSHIHLVDTIEEAADVLLDKDHA